MGRSESGSGVVIWHNPRCSKSRACLELLRSRGVDPQIREYLEDAPNAAEIEEVLVRLGLEPRQLMRQGEGVYASLGLDDPALTAADLIMAMATHPALIERPVVLANQRAALGRPPESVLAIL